MALKAALNHPRRCATAKRPATNIGTCAVRVAQSPNILCLVSLAFRGHRCRVKVYVPASGAETWERDTGLPRAFIHAFSRTGNKNIALPACLSTLMGSIHAGVRLPLCAADGASRLGSRYLARTDTDEDIFMKIHSGNERLNPIATSDGARIQLQPACCSTNWWLSRGLRRP